MKTTRLKEVLSKIDNDIDVILDTNIIGDFNRNGKYELDNLSIEINDNKTILKLGFEEINEDTPKNLHIKPRMTNMNIKILDNK